MTDATAYRAATPCLDDGDLQLYHGDVLTVLQGLPSGIAQTCVTSPPYWGLRDYGTGTWTGGDEACDHQAPKQAERRFDSPHSSREGRNCLAWTERDGTTYRDTCGKCGAQRVDAQLGLEATPEQYVAKMVEVFREVRRVLRADGTLWLNIGDSYAAAASTPGANIRGGLAAAAEKADGRPRHAENRRDQDRATFMPDRTGHPTKPKDLVGIPWRVAFALQADGWYLRSDIIWAKPNPMPESVTDRPTKAHEYIFLFSKQPRYFYDADAVREPHARIWDPLAPNGHSLKPGATYDIEAGKPTAHVRHDKPIEPNPAGRNLRSVWQIATQPFPEAHFATYPEELVRRCILAGTSERGECAECGAPWRRITETEKVATPSFATSYADAHGPDGRDHERASLRVETKGWEPSCSCKGWGTTPTSPVPGPATSSEGTVPQLVLDPFIGSGTTALVARKHGRRSIGIDLSEDYLAIAAKRTQQLSLLGGVA